MITKKRLILFGMAIYIVVIVVATILAMNESPTELGIGSKMIILLGMPWNFVLIFFGALHLGGGDESIIYLVISTIPNILLFARAAANAAIIEELEM